MGGWSTVEQVPIAARDGDQVTAAGPIAFGLVGGLASAGDDVIADLCESDLSFVVTADAVIRGTRARYAALHRRLGALPVQPLVGEGEARGGRRAAVPPGFAAAWSGLGVQQLAEPVPWRALDLRAGGAPWRVLVVDVDQERLGPAFDEQLFWLPKVLAEGHGPVLVLANGPVGTLTEPGPSEGAGRVHDVIERHTDPSRLVLYAATGGGAPEIELPGGPWGEAWIGAGRAVVPVNELRRFDTEIALESGFDAALVRWFSIGGDAEPLREGGNFDPQRYPVAGWWRIELDGDRLNAAFRMNGAQGWDTVYQASWSSDRGWRPAP